MEKMRTAFMAELAGTELEPETIRTVMAAFDRAGRGFTVTEEQTGIIPYNGTPGLVKTYIGVKCVEGLAKETLDNYRRDLEYFFRKMACAPETVTANMVRSYLYGYQREKNVSMNRLNKVRQTLSGFFKWAEDEEYLEKNPMRPIKPIKCVQKQRESLTREELEQMRRACRTTQERAIVDVLYSTGCRASELCEMKKDDINWTRLESEVFGKGSKYRDVYFNAAAKLSLKAYFAERKDDSPYVIVGSKAPHTKMTRGGLGYIIHKIGDRAGIPWVSPHIMRHTMATLALESGAAVQDIQRMLGHANIATTMIYAQTRDEEVKAQHMKCVI